MPSQPSDHAPSVEVYSVGYNPETIDFFQHRRATTHAAFFLPQVRPGTRLLDCGCGPGTITLDFATLAAPAGVIGVDREASQLALALTRAAQQRLLNVHFAAADAYALPFPHASFDAVFLHGVLEHLKAPVAALAEVHRVVKSGGAVGVRHADFGGFLLEPAGPPLDRFAALFAQLMRHNGGDPQAGRHQLAWLKAAGFARVQVSASYDCWTATPEETQRHARFLACLVGQSAFASQLLAAGLTDRLTLERMHNAFLEWGVHPHAFAAEAWGEAIAWKA
jgi:ubiquinone/menaquinone biosynthesis C-methylase UbiE